MIDARRILYASLILSAAMMHGGTIPMASAQVPPATTAPEAPVRPDRLTGPEAWKALIGNSATGKTSDGLRTDYYGADGSIKTLMDSELKTGKWRLQNDRVCIEYPSTSDDDDEEDEEGETCYRVTINGNYAVFVDEDGGGWRLRILTGNPKDL